MAVSEYYNEEGTPKYTINGIEYDFNDLKRLGDTGVMDYIQSLSIGNKRLKELLDAYNNLMSGIESGRVVYDGIKFIDTKGDYTNHKNRNKDYYGLMATYINRLYNNKLLNLNDDYKINYDGASSLGRAVTNHLFNSDIFDYDSFINSDYNKESDQINGTWFRALNISNALSYISDNFDKIFKGYTPLQKSKILDDIDVAQESLSRGVSKNEYLQLSRVLGGINLERAFGDQVISDNPEEISLDQVLNTGYINPENLTLEQYVSLYHPPYSLEVLPTYVLNSDNKYGDWTISKMKNGISSLNQDQTIAFIQKLMEEDSTEAVKQFNKYVGFGSSTIDKNTALQYLLNHLSLISNSEKYYDGQNDVFYVSLFNTGHNNTGYVWSPNTKTLSEVHNHTIPSIRTQYENEFREMQGLPLIESNKNGGVLKALSGSKLWYDGITDYDPNNYTYNYNLEKLVNGDMSDNIFDPYISNKHGLNKGNYTPTSGYTRKQILDIQNLTYYKKFGEDLFNEDNTDFSEMGKVWARLVDKLLPEHSLATFYDPSTEKLRTHWEAGGKDIYGRPHKVFTNLKEYVDYIRNDDILGARHNVLLNEGKRYFYKDANEVKHYVDPNIVSKYKVSENPVESSWNDDGTVYWLDYELTGLLDGEEASDDGSKDIETPLGNKVKDEVKDEGKESNVFGSTLPINVLNNKLLNKLTGEIPGIARMMGSIHTNNKLYDILRGATKPYNKDTYELYHPVTGDFAALQHYNSLAANTRMIGNQATSSDASLNAAKALDANRQSRDLETKGFLADNAEIKRTQAEALKRVEDNIARRSNLANENRKSIHDTIEKLAELKATKYQKNWQNIDNYLADLDSRMRTNAADKKEKYDYYSQLNYKNQAIKLANDEYNIDALEEAANAYRASHNNSLVGWSGLTNYVRAKSKASALASDLLLEAMAKHYGFNYTRLYT